MVCSGFRLRFWCNQKRSRQGTDRKFFLDKGNNLHYDYSYISIRLVVVASGQRGLKGVFAERQRHFLRGVYHDRSLPPGRFRVQSAKPCACPSLARLARGYVRSIP